MVWRVVAGTLTLVAVGLFTATPATATPASNQPTRIIQGTGKSASPSSELQQDAQRASEDLNIPLDEELTRVRQQLPWDQAVAQLQQMSPATFASAGRDWASTPAAWVDLTQDPTPAMLDILRALPMDVRVATDAPANAIEVERATSAVHNALSAVAGVTAVASGPNPHNVGIDVRYSAATDLGNTALQQVADAAARQVLGTAADRVAVTLTSSSNVTGSGTYAGGNDLYDVNDNSFQCTSGFGTTRNGVNGMVTAQHCPNSLTWGGPGRTGIISYEVAATRATDYAIDLQFHKSLGSNVASANFQATGPDDSSRRTVHSAANAVVGDTACKFGYGGYFAGKSNGYGCSQVTKLSQRVHYTAPYSEDFGGLAQTKTQFFTPGDSGGPIFLADQAMGDVSGNSNDGSVSWFTPQTRWGENLSARIIIG